jgi:pimeloyl-ACP methyl ester carboxylesterase
MGARAMTVIFAMFVAAAAHAADAYEDKYRNQGVKPHETALVLMHGKWGAPPAPLAADFAAERFHVVSPEMPWSGARNYDVTYEEALKQLQATVAGLRASGYRRVFIGGQSFGANGALAYAAVYGDVDGVLLFAPGHNPDIDRNGQPRGMIADARSAIAAGRPHETVAFVDYNDGNRSRALQLRADAYVSFFADDGLANMRLSASRVPRPIPVLCVMGNGDYVTRQGSGYFFDRLPRHPKSQYLVSRAAHREVPRASYPLALDWINGLLAE